MYVILISSDLGVTSEISKPKQYSFEPFVFTSWKNYEVSLNEFI